MVKIQSNLLFVLLGFVLGNAGTAFAGNAPQWFVDGRPTADAVEAVQILKRAGADGLNPDDYSADFLAQAVNKAFQASISGADEPTLSGGLTEAVEHFISDLHYGRVDPRHVHASFAIPAKQLDPQSYVREAVASHTLTSLARAAAPSLPLYVSLREALAKYRQLEDASALQRRLPPLATNKIAPGQAYVGTSELARRLMALGDLEKDANIPTRYEAALVDGVKAFQSRHGLTVDGIIGRDTLEQLNTPIAARVRQIELTLERLRWTPLLLGKRMVVVNLPEFVLRAYEVSGGQISVKETMNVIVGKALDTRTPIFFDDMRFIEFSPYWNIPLSIAKAETVPNLRRDRGYFNRQGLEFVRDDGQVISKMSNANLEAVLRGQLRIRQRPGPKNALGDIKFIFPNSDNIYLHHTPAAQLFRLDRRDFSHGCIRVEDPVALARFVLQNQPEWSEERIRDAMENGNSKTIALKEPLPVLIAYGTAIVKSDGKVYFFQDIYGHDRVLEAALIEKGRLVRYEPKGLR
jgi:L,D-transpeptidase YcbB